MTLITRDLACRWTCGPAKPSLLIGYLVVSLSVDLADQRIYRKALSGFVPSGCLLRFLGAFLGSLGGSLGRAWVALGASWEGLGGLLERSGDLLEGSWGLLNLLAAS